MNRFIERVQSLVDAPEALLAEDTPCHAYDEERGRCWRRSLEDRKSLPVLPLALTTRDSVPVDLEYPYRESAKRVYLD